LEGKNHPDSLLQIKAGPETELMMRHQLDDIGWMGDQDSLIRKKKMAALEKEIRLHPQSFFLFESIRRSKELYGKEELAELLNLFDPRVLQSVPGKNLQSYLSSLPAAGSPYPLLHLPDTENRRLPLYDTRRQLNMLVFWASWCKPCRMEIPVLKKLNQQYAAKGLAITSISIDLDQDRWRLALAKEQMGWRQLVIPADSIEKIENIFRFTTIPFLVFTDERGVEIARFADDDENAFSRYEKIIRARLE
jgi:thiol-disulfide isomerase/thioredoxin